MKKVTNQKEFEQAYADGHERIAFSDGEYELACVGYGILDVVEAGSGVILNVRGNSKPVISTFDKSKPETEQVQS